MSLLKTIFFGYAGYLSFSYFAANVAYYEQVAIDAISFSIL